MVQIDESRAKARIIAMWHAGGMDTLVKVMPRNVPPSPGRNVGYCTTFKYVVGRTPAEMEMNVGMRVGSKLGAGADVYLVAPLPKAGQFSFRGYSNTPEGIPTNIKAAHPDYPPGQGVPQWELDGYPQSFLTLFASVLPGQRFTYMVASLPQPV